MKVYLVYQDHLGYRGFTPCKKIIKAFKLQRDMSSYSIIKKHDYEACEAEISDDNEMFWHHGTVAFRDEEEQFSQSLDQYTMDFRRYASHILYYFQFIRLEKHEEELLHKFGRIIYDLLEFLDSDESPNDFYEDIFDIPKMMDSIT
jgi:hypothetical protein